MKQINFKMVLIFLVVVAILLEISSILAIPDFFELPEFANEPLFLIVAVFFMHSIYFIVFLIGLILIYKNKRIGYTVLGVVSLVEALVLIENILVHQGSQFLYLLFYLIICFLSFWLRSKFPKVMVYDIGERKLSMIEDIKSLNIEDIKKKINLKLVIGFLLIIAILIESSPILSFYFKNGFNSILLLIVVSILPIFFMIFSIISLVSILKNKKSGYHYSGIISGIIIFQGPFDLIKHGVKIDTMIVLTYMFWVILCALSFWAYSKFPKEQLSDVDIKKKKMFSSFFVVILIIFFAISLTFQKDDNQQTNEIITNSPLSNLKQDFINKSVEITKKETVFPIKMDDNIMMVDVTAEPSAIRYHYTVSGIDSNKLSIDFFKKDIISYVCGKENDLRDILDSGVNMEYSYLDKDTQQIFLVIFTKEDCLGK